jgi:excisionase family DNA binding protein
MTHTEITRDPGQLGPTGSLVASPNEVMNYLGVGRAKLYELLNANELESFVSGSSRKILWPSIHAYVKRRLEAEAAAPRRRIGSARQGHAA